MQTYKTQIKQAADFLQTSIKHLPRVGIITGTGLGESAGNLDILASFDYNKIPNFPLSTVTSHMGQVLIGKMGDTPVVVFQGRFHLYEGYSPLEVVFPIRVLQALGAKTVILSNAAGGLNLAFREGDIMLIQDHINLTGENPLVGHNEESWGLRFPDMISAYDKKLSQLTFQLGQESGLHLQTGIYAGLKGPSLETPAEIRYLKNIGADAVGFSTVMEVIAAVHAKINILAFSMITNINDPDNPRSANLEDIIKVAEAAAPKLKSIMSRVVAML